MAIPLLHDPHTRKCEGLQKKFKPPEHRDYSAFITETNVLIRMEPSYPHTNFDRSIKGRKSSPKDMGREGGHVPALPIALPWAVELATPLGYSHARKQWNSNRASSKYCQSSDNSSFHASKPDMEKPGQ